MGKAVNCIFIFLVGLVGSQKLSSIFEIDNPVISNQFVLNVACGFVLFCFPLLRKLSRVESYSDLRKMMFTDLVSIVAAGGDV